MIAWGTVALRVAIPWTHRLDHHARLEPHEIGLSQDASADWSVERIDAIGGELTRATRVPTFPGPADRRLLDHLDLPTHGRLERLMLSSRVALGFPWRQAEATVSFAPNDGVPIVDGGVWLPLGDALVIHEWGCVLPLRPLWSGLLSNTLVWTAVVAIIAVIIRRVHRIERLRWQHVRWAAGLSILSGVVLTIGSAFGLGAIADPQQSIGRTQAWALAPALAGPNSPDTWVTEVDSFGAATAIWEVAPRDATTVPTRAPVTALQPFARRGERAFAEHQATRWCVEARGWPWLSMWCLRHDAPAPSADGRDQVATGGIVLDDRPFESFWRWPPAIRILPLGVLPLGFAFNVAVFSAATLVMMSLCGLPMLRRSLRLSRRRCGVCAHALLEDLRCTECGIGWEATLRSHVRERSSGAVDHAPTCSHNAPP